jgi:hypothetical protein
MYHEAQSDPVVWRGDPVLQDGRYAIGTLQEFTELQLKGKQP